jgi:hypothetical protein
MITDFSLDPDHERVTKLQILAHTIQRFRLRSLHQLRPDLLRRPAPLLRALGDDLLLNERKARTNVNRCTKIEGKGRKDETNSRLARSVPGFHLDPDQQGVPVVFKRVLELGGELERMSRYDAVVV